MKRRKLWIWLAGSLACAAGPVVHGDVFQWEWVDPADPSQGKRPSAVLCPMGSGLVLGPDSWALNHDLSQAYLIGSDLAGSHFWGTVFENADFAGADLTRAQFRSATLSGANLSGAKITGAWLAWATFGGFTREQFESTASYAAGQLAGICFERNDLAGWNFSGQDLSGVDFQCSDLAGADFTKSHLDGTNFSCSTLTGADFKGAIIAGTSFSGTTSTGFTRAQFESTASYATGQLAGICLGENDLTGWDFAGKNLSGARFESSTLTGGNFRGANIRGVSFQSTTLIDVDFTGADLSLATFTYSALSKANLSGSDLRGAFFLDSTLSGADFTGANIAGVTMHGATDKGFTRAQFESTVNYATGQLTGIWLDENDLTGWDFAGKNLAGSSFGSSKLTGADFTGAVIAGVSFSDTTSRGFTREQFESTANYATGQLSGIRLGENDLAGWSFAGKDLSGADFWAATLTDADFTDAIIAGAGFYQATSAGFTQAQFESTASFATGQLAGIVLQENDLSGWDFAGKNLSGASFESSTLTGGNFTGANLRGVWFWSTTLTGADFTGANLSETCFWNATLASANLTGADARGAYEMLYASAASTRNFVHPDGTMESLAIVAGESFRVWDYAGVDTTYDSIPDWPIGITIHGDLAIDPGGTLRIGLEDAEWGSTIAFAPGVTVLLGGTLQVELVNGFVPSPGDAWRVFDFTGVSPIGEFDAYSLPAGAGWNYSTLLTDGTIRYVPEPAGGVLTLLGFASTFLVQRRRRFHGWRRCGRSHRAARCALCHR